jgi:hypothetical protein
LEQSPYQTRKASKSLNEGTDSGLLVLAESIYFQCILTQYEISLNFRADPKSLSYSVQIYDTNTKLLNIVFSKNILVVFLYVVYGLKPFNT